LMSSEGFKSAKNRRRSLMDLIDTLNFKK